MSSIILTGDTSGTLTVSAPLVAGSNTLTLAAATGTLSPLVSATAVASTSGTSIDFTGIPSWAKRITVMFSGVSTSGTSNYLIQIGDSGGIENTGYTSGAFDNSTSANSTAGFLISSQNTGAALECGNLTITNLSSNTWIESGSISSGTTGYLASSGGSKSLSDVLTQVRITTVNGTDTFDAGTINIMYEG
jgi:hypothetical protein